MSTSSPKRSRSRDHAGPRSGARAATAPMSHQSAQARPRRRRFPGWRWVAVAPAFPLAALIGRGVGGPVDAVEAALIGGALTAAGLAAVQWWAADDELGRAGAWIGAGGVGYGVGLAAGAALVGYDTALGDLAIMGLVSGAGLGAAQGCVLARQGRRGLAVSWALAMPVLFALGWCASTMIGVDVENQYTVFGAAGAVLFMLGSGVLLASVTDALQPVA
jgi:hypothetical protein